MLALCLYSLLTLIELPLPFSFLAFICGLLPIKCRLPFGLLPVEFSPVASVGAGD